MDPIAKKILDALRCPICKSRIDLFDWKHPFQGRKYNFCCSSNWEHYRIFFVHWGIPPYIDYETVIIYDDNRMYHVTQYFDNGIDNTEFFVYNVNADKLIIDELEDKKHRFSFEKKLFDFSQTNEEKIINRIKTILVFQ